MKNVAIILCVATTLCAAASPPTSPPVPLPPSVGGVSIQGMTVHESSCSIVLPPSMIAPPGENRVTLRIEGEGGMSAWLSDHCVIVNQPKDTP